MISLEWNPIVRYCTRHFLLIFFHLHLFSALSAQNCTTGNLICTQNNNWDFRSQCGVSYDGCNANDVQLLTLRLVDPNQSGTCVQCVQGQMVTWNLVADIAFGQNGDRSCFAIAGDLFVNGEECCVFSRVSNTCVQQAANTTIEIPFGTIQFTCGDALSLSNIVIGWASNCNSQSNNCLNGAYCPGTSKCGLIPNITIKTPVGAECYEVPAVCMGENGRVGVTARGGDGMFTYYWEDAAQNPAGNTAEIIVSPGDYFVTVTDGEGCSANCTVSLTTALDTEKPVITCPATIMTNNDPGQCGAVVSFMATATDNCPGTTITYNPLSGSMFPVGTTSVEAIATDASGNMETCTFNVVVNDNEVTANCQDIDLFLSSNGTAVISSGDVNNGSSDNCGIAGMSVSPSVFDCSNIGQNTVMLTVTDINNNSTTCTSIVNVIDNIPPTALCQTGVILYLDPAGIVSLNASQIDNGSFDNCGVPSLSIEPSSFDCSNVGINQVILTATDGSNLTSTCTTSVEVRDDLVPMAQCQNITIQLDASGNASISAADINNQSSDNCGIASMSVFPSSFNCTNVGQNTVTLTVTDVNNNVNTCNATVNIQDNEDPMARCQNITVELDASGNVSITAADIDNGSFDNCGIADLQVNPSSFQCSDLGNNLVTLTVTDFNGNTASCVATVTVVDAIDPVINCPANMTVLNDPGQCGANVNYTATYIDNCPATVTYNPPSGSFFSINTSTTVTCTVTDQAGNTDQCTFVVTVMDNVAPAINCPPDLTINCEDSQNPSNTGFGTSSDPCGGPNGIVTYNDAITPGSCPNSFTITRTWTATDAANNSQSCDQIITIVDTQAPSITCPTQINVSCESDVPAPDPNSVIANDNCTSVGNITKSHVSDVVVGTSPIYITRTYVAIDECQNANTCTQLIVVQNLVAPSLTCPAPVSVQCMDDVPPPNINDVIAQANCGGAVTVTHLNDVISGSCPTTIVRTYRGTDESGNITDCSQTITVSDTVSPLITNCPADADFGCFTSGEPTSTNLPAPLTDPLLFGASDNCTPSDQLIVSYVDIGPQINGCIYLFERTYTITDACGNATECQPVQYSFTYDTEPPVFSNLPEDQVYACGDPVPSVPGAPTVTDECLGSVTVTFSEVVNTASCLGEAYVRTWVATDACGNTSSYSQVASKQDLTPPEILRPADTIIHCGQPIPPLQYEIVESCKESRYEEEFHEEVLPGKCACEYTIMRIWHVYNNCLSEIRDTQFIYVVDETGPTITLINPMLAGLENGGTMKMYGCAEPDAVMTDIIADDCCGVADIVTYDSLLAYKSCEAFEYFALWVCGYEVTDPCGNKSTFRFYVQQIDTTAPAFVTPDSFSHRLDLLCGDTIPAEDTIAILDDCDLIPALSYRVDTVGFYPDSFAIIRSWEANDACLNTEVLTQTITVCNFEPDSFVGEIGNLVWQDLNENGIQELTEPGLNGVSVELYADRDNDFVPDERAEQIVLSKTRNGIDGQYFFSNLEPGRYYIKAITTPDQSLVAMHVGGDDKMDSDVDPTTGFSYALEVGPGQSNLDIDIGMMQIKPEEPEEEQEENEENEEETAKYLSSFSVEKQGCNNVLKWSVNGNINENIFEIHRSYDGQKFEQIGVVQSSSAHTSFSYEDEDVQKQVYYRLLYQHPDGTDEVSQDIYVVNNCHSVMNFVLFPNPTTNHFTISYDNNSTDDLSGQILDVYGRVVKNWQIGKRYKGETDKLDVDLANGLYWIRIWDGTNQNIKPIMIMQNQR